jgi:membrane-associated phospholipid phosphatase
MLRHSELVLATYFGYVALLAVLLPAPQRFRPVIIAASLFIIGGYYLLARRGARDLRYVRVLRDWLPLALLLFAYQEMGWFAEPRAGHRLESIWVVWDRAILLGGLSAAVEALGPVVPALLELSYTLVYTLAPFAVALLYAYRRPDRADLFLFLFSVGVLGCYAQFPFWPSEPPRTVFPGQDFPAYHTAFRDLNFAMLHGYGIHTSVFPSAHVAGAFSAAFGMRLALPERKWPWRFLLVMAVLIATATVYGRYHYVADAAAGLAMSLLALGVTLAIYRKS